MKPEDIASASESSQQQALFCWAAQSGIPELKYMYAIPNGGARNAATAARLKAEGVKPGVPDICLPVPQMITRQFVFHDSVRYCGLYIEMKVGSNKPDNQQQDFHWFLLGQGYKLVVCYSWIEARDAILNYLKLR